ncbi:MAG: hypothetical protein GX491_12680 [Chloroflexi bacterium]|nr:hypothetical protein [Chloroflexota bacterium]
MSIEEEYADVLQNIELAIVGVYKEKPELTDYNVESAITALGRTYQYEKTSGPDAVPVRPKGELANKVYDAVRAMCEWRLGRENLVDEEGQPMQVEPITIDEIQACLKRIRKSVNYWNKESGTRGYLDYISQFFF